MLIFNTTWNKLQFGTVKIFDLFNLNGCIEDVNIKEGSCRRKKSKGGRGSENLWVTSGQNHAF